LSNSPKKQDLSNSPKKADASPKKDNLPKSILKSTSGSEVKSQRKDGDKNQASNVINLGRLSSDITAK